MEQPIINKLYKKYNKENKYPNHADFFPKPLMCYIVGRTNSGKTTLLIDFLLKGGVLDYHDVYIYTKTGYQKHYDCLKQYYKEHLDAIGLYYYMKENNFSTREIYNNLKKEFTKFEDFVKVGVQPKDEIVYFYDRDNEIQDPSKLDPDKSHIIVFDDVLSENQNKMRDYYTRGRHNKSSVFYLSQSFYKVAKHCIRENVNLYIIFQQSNKDLESFYRDHVNPDVELKDFIIFCKKAWNTEHGYIKVNCDKLLNNGKYWINNEEYKFHTNS